MLIAASKIQANKLETQFELSQGQRTNECCFICCRSEGEIVGPFTNKQKETIFLHKDCIEINTYSYFSVTLKKWVNIETMVKRLSVEAQYQCYRCTGFGATVSCATCGKNFHGYYCAGMYLIPLQPDGKAGEATNP